MLIAGEMERLRPLVGLKGWDYCVVWKLSEDQRFLDWLDCCCAGGGEELLFPVSSVLPCRDGMVQHPRTKSCDLLVQLPSSISLDSGNVHGQTLISNQPRWLNNFCNSSDSSILQETVGTGLLIPVLGGLIELFVAKQVDEDQHIIDFVTTQCHIIAMEQAMANTGNIDLMFSVNVNGGNADLDQKDPNINFLAPISSATAMENLKNDIPIDRIRLGSSSPMNMNMNMNLLQHDIFLDGSHDSFLSEKEQLGDDDHKDSSTKRKANQPDSVSDCSEKIDDDDDNDNDDDLKFRRKTGKGAQSKNIDAERRRRKKLNDRLYTLRSLVPKISKLDRASILGDAIEFVKELQKQAKDLQDELEENSEDESGKIINPNITSNSNKLPSENFNDNASGLNIGHKSENEESRNQFSKQNPETDHIANAKAQQQMEPQVEVAQIEGNEFFVKVFYEHKAGGFLKLMEALSSLGMEVTNANVTTCKGLVSNAFKVEKRDSEMVQAEHVRDSLLALTKNPSEKWPDYSENGGGFDFNHHHRHLHSHLFSSHHHLQN